MTVGSLFAGIGGFDLGMERAGFRTLWQVETHPSCTSILARHFPEAKRFGDIREVDPRALEPVDVVCGGFPCQDLSVAGHRAGLKGARSGLFYRMMEVVDGLRPAWLLWENVPGLLSSAPEGEPRGSDFAAVLGELDRLGFAGAWTTLDARYFGVAQRRSRVFGLFTTRGLGARTASEILSLAARMPGRAAPGEKRGKVIPPELAELLRAVASRTPSKKATGDAAAEEPKTSSPSSRGRSKNATGKVPTRPPRTAT